MRPLAFQLLAELSDRRFVSGTSLAEKYGVSRSAISDALRDVTEHGVEIFSLTRKGYRLAQAVELLDVVRIREALGRDARRVDVEVVNSIASTNTELLARAAAGAPGGACLAAEIQTAGRGRRGRTWQSSLASSLTFSLLWRFDKGAAQLGGLSLLVGLALVRVLRAQGVSAAAVKWPNDIVVDHKKLAGILIETQGDMLGPTAAVIGIGINMRLSAIQCDAIDQPVTDLASQLPSPASRNVLLAALLKELVATLDRFGKEGFAPFHAEWIACHALHGEKVRISHASGEVVDAVVTGLAVDGSLLVEARGKIEALTSAEISIRPRLRKAVAPA
jgi:BirA family biotin operon repressor/biotin-[acetyl-CoA-carboxylase] ligase